MILALRSARLLLLVLKFELEMGSEMKLGLEFLWVLRLPGWQNLAEQSLNFEERKSQKQQYCPRRLEMNLELKLMSLLESHLALA